jgi:hypothetical protein
LRRGRKCRGRKRPPQAVGWRRPSRASSVSVLCVGASIARGVVPQQYPVVCYSACLRPQLTAASQWLRVPPLLSVCPRLCHLCARPTARCAAGGRRRPSRAPACAYAVHFVPLSLARVFVSVCGRRDRVSRRRWLAASESCPVCRAPARITVAAAAAGDSPLSPSSPAATESPRSPGGGGGGGVGDDEGGDYDVDGDHEEQVCVCGRGFKAGREREMARERLGERKREMKSARAGKRERERREGASEECKKMGTCMHSSARARFSASKRA